MLAALFSVSSVYSRLSLLSPISLQNKFTGKHLIF